MPSASWGMPSSAFEPPGEPCTPSYSRGRAPLRISSDHNIHLSISFDHEIRTIRAQKGSVAHLVVVTGVLVRVVRVVCGGLAGVAA
jgi:hypothetical protein